MSSHAHSSDSRVSSMRVLSCIRSVLYMYMINKHLNIFILTIIIFSLSSWPGLGAVDAWSISNSAVDQWFFPAASLRWATVSTATVGAVSSDNIFSLCCCLSFLSFTLDLREEGFCVGSGGAGEREREREREREMKLIVYRESTQLHFKTSRGGRNVNFSYFEIPSIPPPLNTTMNTIHMHAAATPSLTVL